MLTTLLSFLPLPSLQEMTALKCYVLDFNKPKKTDTVAFYVNCRANGPCAAARQATFLELGTVCEYYLVQYTFYVENQPLQMFTEITSF